MNTVRHYIDIALMGRFLLEEMAVFSLGNRLRLGGYAQGWFAQCGLEAHQVPNHPLRLIASYPGPDGSKDAVFYGNVFVTDREKRPDGRWRIFFTATQLEELSPEQRQRWMDNPPQRVDTAAEERLLRYLEPYEPRVLVVWDRQSDAQVKELFEDYGFKVTDEDEEDSHLLSLDSFYGWLEEQRAKAEGKRRELIQQLLDELTPIAEQYHYLWVR